MTPQKEPRKVTAFTIRLQSRRLRSIRAASKKRLKKFHDLKTIDPQTKQSVLRQVRRCEIQLAATDHYETWIRTLTTVPFLAVLMSSMFAVPALFPHVAPWLVSSSKIASVDAFVPDLGFGNYGSDFYLAGFFVALAFLFVAFVPIVVMGALMSRRTHRFVSLNPLIICWLAICAFVGAVVIYKFTPTNMIITAGLAGAVAYIVGVFPFMVVTSILRIMINRRITNLYPDVVLVDNYLDVLAKTESGAARWNEIEFKQQLIRKLEDTAYCLEVSLPGRLRTGNYATDSWIKERSEEMAEGTRALTRWIFTPQVNTYERFKTRVADCLLYSARGDWDSFERVKPEKLSRPELLRNRLKLVISAILSGAVPLVVLMLIKQLRIVSDPILTYVTVGAYIWAALSLLSSFDPHYGAKLTALKDISQLLPFGKKGKD